MAHFIGGIAENRGPASRLGSAKSGIDAYAQGWHIGAKIRVYVNSEGEDIVSVSLTTGSNGYGSDKCLGQFKRTEDGFEKV